MKKRSAGDVRWLNAYFVHKHSIVPENHDSTSFKCHISRVNVTMICENIAGCLVTFHCVAFAAWKSL